MPKAYHLVLTYHEGAAFFSILNKLMNHIQKYKPVAAISWNVQFPFNIYGEGETFSQVFEPYIDETYEGYEIETILCKCFTNQSLTGHTARYLYNEEDCKRDECIQSMDWRNELNSYWKKYCKIIHPSVLDLFPEFQKVIDEERTNGKTIITFLARHLDHGREQMNKVMPSFSLYDEKIKEIAGNDLSKVVLICMTDSMEAYNYFSEKYKDHNILFPPTERQWAHEPQTAFSEGTNARIPMAMLSVLYLTTGDHFIHPISNMSTAVMYINPKIKNHYLVGV